MIGVSLKYQHFCQAALKLQFKAAVELSGRKCEVQEWDLDPGWGRRLFPLQMGRDFPRIGNGVFQEGLVILRHGRRQPLVPRDGSFRKIWGNTKRMMT